MVGARFRLLPGLFRFRRLASRLAARSLPLAVLCSLPLPAFLAQGAPAAAGRPGSGCRTARRRRRWPPRPCNGAGSRAAPRRTRRCPHRPGPGERGGGRDRDGRRRTELPAGLAARNRAFRRRTAKAHLWQQRVELARLRSEALQESGSAYIDWLAAQAARSSRWNCRSTTRSCPKRAAPSTGRKERAIAGRDPGNDPRQRKQALVRFRQQAEAAAAKIAYLLDAGETLPISGEAALVPVDLVDAAVSAEALVHQAQDNGPGVRELAGLQAALEKVLAGPTCCSRPAITPARWRRAAG